jgi:peptidoglycan hydrolase CwlO-like protein
MTDTSPETFAAVADLIKLVVDAKACAKRVDELQKLVATAAAAEARLAADTATHAATKAALEAREAAVTERERVVAADEAALREQREPEKYPLSANLEPGGRSHSGLTREAYRS